MGQVTLFCIPLEVRLDILRFALSQVECRVVDCWSLCCMDNDDFRLDFSDRSSEKNLALFYTCKQLRTECLAILGYVVPLLVDNNHQLGRLCDSQLVYRNSYLKTVTQAKVLPRWSWNTGTRWLKLLQDYTTISALNLVIDDCPCVPELKDVKPADIETEEVKVMVELASIRIFKREKARLEPFKERQLNLTVDLMLGDLAFELPSSTKPKPDFFNDFVLVSRIQA